MYRLGLQRYPTAASLLKLASEGDSTVRSTALQYFLDNYAARYSDYKPTEVVDLAFVPAIKSDKSFLAKPREVRRQMYIYTL